jgi:hypothetical protein
MGHHDHDPPTYRGGGAAAGAAGPAPCTPYATVTRTEWVVGPAGDASFSCPQMEVTNAAGDVLALDESCALNFEPAEPADPSPSSGRGTEGADQGWNGGGGGTEQQIREGARFRGTGFRERYRYLNSFYTQCKSLMPGSGQ